jgi:hypothetical protein
MLTAGSRGSKFACFFAYYVFAFFAMNVKSVESFAFYDAEKQFIKSLKSKYFF